MIDVLWRELPWQVKICSCVLGVFVIGSCISPAAIGLRVLFQADQQTGCQTRLLNYMNSAGERSGLTFTEAQTNFANCKINSTMVGEYVAAKEGRSILFQSR